MADPLFVEMSIHHFDLMRALLGGDPVSVWAESWNPPWSGFKGDIVGTARFRFEGGVSVLYHGNKISRGDLTSWYGDIVAEGEHATLSMVYPRLYLTRRGARQTAPVGPQTDLMAASDPQAGQDAALAEFLDAIAQGRPAGDVGGRQPEERRHGARRHRRGPPGGRAEDRRLPAVNRTRVPARRWGRRRPGRARTGRGDARDRV